MDEVITAEEVLKPNYLPTYNAHIQLIWEQLIALNHNIFFIEKIESFPFDIFSDIQTPFWQFIKNALIEASIMIIWRVGKDTDSRTVTFENFHKGIETNIKQNLDEDVKIAVDAKLNHIKMLLAQLSQYNNIDKVRHNYYSHLNFKLNEPANPLIRDFAISLHEIKEILDILKSMFDILSFSHQHGLWLWDKSTSYNDISFQNNETDIDKILDAVTRTSFILNMPEKSASSFQEIFYPTLSQEQKNIINKYRVKFGLSQI